MFLLHSGTKEELVKTRADLTKNLDDLSIKLNSILLFICFI